MKILIALTLLALCSGCASLIQDQDGTTQLFSPKAMVAATNKATDDSVKKQSISALGPMTEANLALLIDDRATDLEMALRNFDKNCGSASNTQCRLTRNSVQDRLIASSNAICREYKNSLKRSHAETNIGYGSLSTLLGGIGAMVTSATPARLFSGAASISNGVRAEVNQSMYSMLAIEIVTKAIDKSRQDSLKEIDMSQRREIGGYSIERALADAEEYHTKCSLLSGLQEASSAVTQSNNIGLKTLSQTLEDLGQSTKIQVGKRSFDIYNSNPVFLDSVCKSIKSQYDDFISKNINITLLEYSSANKNWNDFYGKEGNCATASVTSIDQEWRDLVGNFTKTSDDQEKDKFISQIAAQQSKAAAFSKYLNETLIKTIGDIKTKFENNVNIQILQKDLNSEFTNIPLDIKTPIDTANKEKFVVRLQEFSRKVTRSQILIMATATPISAADLLGLGKAIDSITILTKSSSEENIIASETAILSAYKSSVQPWVLK